MTQEQAQSELAGLVKQEVANHEKEQVWVTNRVAFNMRELIQQCRKNYWGVYDEPFDPVTGKEKIWVPLTRLLVDSVRKNADMDTKDIRFRAKRPEGYATTDVVRGFVREWLSENEIDFHINQSLFTTAIEGTDVWKTYEQGGRIVRKDVDLLNIYIDPQADSIQKAYRFTERALMLPDEIKQMDWQNVEGVQGKENLEREDGLTAGQNKIKYVDVYESWGKYPKKLVMAAQGKDYDEDDKSEVDAQVIISGIDSDDLRFHFTKQNTTKDKAGNIIKPYEESWYIKVPGRWYGVGIAETVIALQEWVNMVVNLRHNKNTISQLGLLKLRKGAGVTQQMLSRLVTNGVIELTDPDRDLQQLQISESGASSYQDEQIAKNWAQEITSVFDMNIGELPASTSATGAVIQNQQQNSAFQLITESYEHFIQRWIDRHILPRVPKLIKAKGRGRIYGDVDNIRALRERVVAKLAMDELEKLLEDDKVPSEEQLLFSVQKAEDQLREKGDLFVEIVDDILAEAMDTEVFMTNTEVDVGTTVRNLLELRNGVDQQTAASMTAQALDLLGLSVPKSLEQAQTAQPAQPVQAAQAPDPEAIVDQFARANTVTNEQR